MLINWLSDIENLKFGYRLLSSTVLRITRLEILSRPKAPKILKELLSNSKELPSPRPTKLLKNFKRFQNIKKIPKDSKKIPKESKRFRKIPKDSKKIPKESKRCQKITNDSQRFRKKSKRIQMNPKESKRF